MEHTPDDLTDALLVAPPAMPTHSIDSKSNLATVMQADIEISNMVLNGLAIGWSRAAKVDDICKLALTTMKTLESRRKLLNMQYGSESYKGGNGIVDPLD